MNQTQLATSADNIIHHICDFSGPKPTPKQWMTFKDNKKGSFDYQITPDSGATSGALYKDCTDCRRCGEIHHTGDICPAFKDWCKNCGC